MNITPLQIREILEKELNISSKDSLKTVLAMIKKSSENDTEIKPVEIDDDRKFFDVPVRYTTREFYSEKMSLEEFQKSVLSIDEFIKNMKSLGMDKKEFYAEQWMENFSNWNEIEQKNPEE